MKWYSNRGILFTKRRSIWSLCFDSTGFFMKNFSFLTNACDYAYGAVLAQKRDQELRPVVYYSKNMTSAQTRYSSSGKELLAIVMSAENFHPYLFGRQFCIYTDHMPLQWILSKQDLSNRISRWVIRIGNYGFQVLFKAGKENVVADALSRMTDPDQYISEEDYNDVLISLVTRECYKIRTKSHKESTNNIKMKT